MRKLDGYPGCLACGKANPQGFQLDLFLDGRRVLTRFRLPGHMVGFPGATHGGVLCTLLDEVMTWAAIESTGRFHVTGEMTVRFLLPAAPGEEIQVWGEPGEDRKRYLVCKGEVHNAEGRLVAKAEGKFFPVPPDRQREMEERWRRELAALAGGG